VRESASHRKRLQQIIVDQRIDRYRISSDFGYFLHPLQCVIESDVTSDCQPDGGPTPEFSGKSAADASAGHSLPRGHGFASHFSLILWQEVLC
jgi:hypothetical protein